MPTYNVRYEYLSNGMDNIPHIIDLGIFSAPSELEAKRLAAIVYDPKDEDYLPGYKVREWVMSALYAYEVTPR